MPGSGKSALYVTDDAAIPVDFALYLPEEWLESRRRKLAGVPDDVTFQPKWRLALGLIDQAPRWGIRPGVVAADAGYGNTVDFRVGLVERQFQYAVGIDRSTAVWPEPITMVPPPYCGIGRPRKKRADLPQPVSVLELSRSLPAENWQCVTWREGTKGPMTSRFASLRVLPSHCYQHQPLREDSRWLLIEWQDTERAPDRFWLSNVAATTDLPALVRLVKVRWWIEQSYQQLKDGLGLDHYEGRSWQGWHHHVTLTMVAFAFLVLEMLRLKKNCWAEYALAEDSP